MTLQSSIEQQEQACRLWAMPWLPDSAFDEALAQAQQYHRDNPPLEFIERTIASDMPLKESERNFIARVNCDTKRKLLAEHRERLMRPFVALNVPPAVAGRIVDTLILDLTPE